MQRRELIKSFLVRWGIVFFCALAVTYLVLGTLAACCLIALTHRLWL